MLLRDEPVVPDWLRLRQPPQHPGQSTPGDDPVAELEEFDREQREHKPSVPPLVPASQPAPKVPTPAAVQEPPDDVPRPSGSDLVTIAQAAIGAWYGAARGGLSDFENIVANQPDWGAFWMNIAGNVIWATACFVFAPETTVFVAGRQFAISLTGIATSALATAPSDKAEFHTAAVEKHLNAISTQLNDQVDAVTRDVDALATRENWHDHRTRRELLTRLFRPEFITIYAGGVPNVDTSKVSRQVMNDLFIEANELANMRGAHVDSTGLVTYHYDVSGAVDHSTLVDSVEPTSKWGFHLRKVEVSLPTGGGAAVQSLVKGGKLRPSKTRLHKMLKLTAPGARLYVQDNEWEIDMDGQNKITTTWPGGIFLSMDDPDEWAEHAVKKVWGPNGLPPDVENFEIGPSWW